MAQVILIENDHDLRNLLSINLTKFLGIDLIIKENCKDAMALLEIIPSFDLIICHINKEIDSEFNELESYIDDHLLNTKLFILGAPPSIMGPEIIIQKDSSNWRKTITMVGKILSIRLDHSRQIVDSDYFEIPLDNFLDFKHTPCDIFLKGPEREGSKNTEGHYFSKQYRIGDKVSNAFINHLKSRGVSSLFISKNKRHEFKHTQTNDLIKLLEKRFKVEHRLIVNGRCFDFALDELYKTGFSSGVFQIVDGIVESMVKTYYKTPFMTTLLKKVLTSKTSMQYQMAHTISLIALECLKNLKILTAKDSRNMTYAAFFCDLSLVDQYDWAQIATMEELEISALNEKDWDRVFSHALKSSYIIKDREDIDPEVVKYVINHHGSIKGKGYSSIGARERDIKTQVFIVAVEFATYILSTKNALNKQDTTPVIEHLKLKFPTEDMQSIINPLMETLDIFNK